MTSEPNPYASPPVASDSAEVANATLVDSDLHPCPDLPLTFVVPASTLMIMTPLGMIAGMVAVISILSVLWPQDAGYDEANMVAAIVVATLTGGTAYGCLIALRSRIVVGHAGLELIDLCRRPIYFVDIKS